MAPEPVKRPDPSSDKNWLNTFSDLCFCHDKVCACSRRALDPRGSWYCLDLAHYRDAIWILFPLLIQYSLTKRSGLAKEGLN